MPNNLVFNNVASQLQTTINGVDGGGIARPILTDTDGRLDLGSVTVTATDLDIRPLTDADIVTVTAIDFDSEVNFMMDRVVVVRSRQQAFALENYLFSRGIKAAIASTPVGLGKGCSLSLWFYATDTALVASAIKVLGISIIGIYQKDSLNRWFKVSY